MDIVFIETPEFIQKINKISSQEEFEKLLDFILGKIKIVGMNEYDANLDEAKRIMGLIDIEDIDYIALALSIKNKGIWSDDAHFQKQAKIKVYKTDDILKLMKDDF